MGREISLYFLPCRLNRKWLKMWLISTLRQLEGPGGIYPHLYSWYHWPSGPFKMVSLCKGDTDRDKNLKVKKVHQTTRIMDSKFLWWGFQKKPTGFRGNSFPPSGPNGIGTWMGSKYQMDLYLMCCKAYISVFSISPIQKEVCLESMATPTLFVNLRWPGEGGNSVPMCHLSWRQHGEIVSWYEWLLLVGYSATLMPLPCRQTCPQRSWSTGELFLQVVLGKKLEKRDPVFRWHGRELGARWLGPRNCVMHWVGEQGGSSIITTQVKGWSRRW